MTEMLRTDGVNDVASFTGAPAINAGTSDYIWWFKGIVRQAPTGICGFVGTSSSGSSSGFVTNANLQLLVYSSGSLRYSTPNNFFIVGESHHYRLEHDAGGAWRAYRDDMSTPIASGTFTGNGPFGTLNQMFRSSSGSPMFLAADVEEIGLQSGAFSEVWQAALSGGIGNILPTVSGNNNATLINFPTDNSQWVGFDVTYTVSGTGQLTLGGAGNAVQGYVARGTGQLTFSGAGSAWQTPYASGTGQLTFSGTGAAISDNTYQVSGVSVLTFSGIGSAWQTPYASGASTVSFSGIGAAISDNTYQVSGTGQLTFSGIGSAWQTPYASGASALVFGGSGAASTDTGSYSVSGTGQLTFSGIGSAWQTPYASGESTISFSGAGSAWQTPYTGGTSTVSFSGAGRVANGDQQQYGVVRVPVTAVITKISRAVSVKTVLRYNVEID